MRISADQFIDRPIESVFERLCGQYFVYQRVWDPSIIEIVPTGGSTISIGSHARVTRKTKNKVEQGESTIVAVEAPNGITVESNYPKNREIRRISCHRLNGGGTRLHVEIDSELHGIAKLVAPLALNLLEKALAYSLHVAKLAVEESDAPDHI